MNDGFGIRWSGVRLSPEEPVGYGLYKGLIEGVQQQRADTAQARSLRCAIKTLRATPGLQSLGHAEPFRHPVSLPVTLLLPAETVADADAEEQRVDLHRGDFRTARKIDIRSQFHPFEIGV